MNLLEGPTLIQSISHIRDALIAMRDLLGKGQPYQALDLLESLDLGAADKVLHEATLVLSGKVRFSSQSSPDDAGQSGKAVPAGPAP